MFLFIGENIQFNKTLKKLELKGIDPLTFRMQSGRSTTELQPHIYSIWLYASIKWELLFDLFDKFGVWNAAAQFGTVISQVLIVLIRD